MEKDTYKPMFAIKDTIAELYEPPFVDINKGTALRKLQDLMQSNPQSPYSKFPETYELYEIGLYNEITGGGIFNENELVVRLNDIKPTTE